MKTSKIFCLVVTFALIIPSTISCSRTAGEKLPISQSLNLWSSIYYHDDSFAQATDWRENESGELLISVNTHADLLIKDVWCGTDSLYNLKVVYNVHFTDATSSRFWGNVKTEGDMIGSFKFDLFNRITDTSVGHGTILDHSYDALYAYAYRLKYKNQTCAELDLLSTEELLAGIVIPNDFGQVGFDWVVHQDNPNCPYD